jgi:hypothetical protein
LVGWEFYGDGDAGPQAEIDAVTLTELPASGAGIELTSPGTYLVNLRAAYQDRDYFAYAPLVFLLGDTTDPLRAFNECFPLDLSCDVTYTLVVSAAEVPMKLTAYAVGECDPGPTCNSPFWATAAVYSMSDQVPDLSTLPSLPSILDCGCPPTPLRGAKRQMNRFWGT